MENGVVKISIKPKWIITSLLLFLLPVFFYMEMNYRSSVVTLMTYYDEAFTIVCILYVLLSFSVHKPKRFEIGIMLLTVLVVAIGFVGNIVYEIQPKTMAVLVDALSVFKISFTFVAFYIIGTRDKDLFIFRYLLPIAKAFIMIAAFFALINLVADIGMSGEERYGIRSFYFIFKNEARLGIITAVCFLIILYFTTDPKKTLIYSLLSLFIILCTTKGTNFIIFISYFILVFLWKRTRSRISMPQIVIIVSTVAIASRYQIQKYLMNSESPRMRLIRYGFTTANNYFPFGSGFATYGSDQAFKNYSALYLKYGFPKLYGLSPKDGRFLNDCYFGMIVGQFGYFGMVVFLGIFILMFVAINRINFPNNRIKALTISILICLIISAVGSAIIKSSIGMFAIMALGLSCGYMDAYSTRKQNEINSKLKN